MVCTPSESRHGMVDRTTRAAVRVALAEGESTPGPAALLEDGQAAPPATAGVAPAPAPRTDRPVRRLQPPRDVVRTVRCPTCQAAPGELCRGRRRARTANHFARVELATELRYGQRLELPRTGARTRPQAAVSRGAVSLDSDDSGATLGTDLDSASR
jgi:hypothetical protein